MKNRDLEASVSQFHDGKPIIITITGTKALLSMRLSQPDRKKPSPEESCKAVNSNGNRKARRCVRGDRSRSEDRPLQIVIAVPRRVELVNLSSLFY